MNLKEKMQNLVIKNLQSAKRMDQIETIRNYVWDNLDGDQHFLNLCVIAEGSCMGQSRLEILIDSSTIKYNTKRTEASATWTRSEYYVIMDKAIIDDGPLKYIEKLYKILYS
jgi:hypothetical protein